MIEKVIGSYWSFRRVEIVMQRIFRNKLILLLLFAAIGSTGVAQRRTGASSKYTSSAYRRSVLQASSSTIKRTVNNSLKGYEWVRSSEYLRKKEFFPKEFEYCFYKNHPQYKVIDEVLYNEDGRLIAVAALQDDVFFRGIHRAEYYESLITALQIGLYFKNAYNVDKATKEERMCIEHRLFDVDYDWSVHKCVDKAGGYVDQLRLDAENIVYGYVHTITRLSATSFQVQFADRKWNPTFSIRIDYKSDGDFMYKEVVTYDGMSFSNTEELLNKVKQSIGFDETKYRKKVSNSASERSAEVSEKVYDVVEQQPKFNGNVLQWLAQNIQYPAVAVQEGIEGRVVVQFVVNEYGSVSDITVVRGIDASLNAEAKRVVSTMPRWIPGTQNGKPVSCRYTMPIMFKLQ